MKTFFTIIILLISLIATSLSQEINVWQKGVKSPTKFPSAEVDSIRITPCDTNIYDMTGCDLDIDTTIVNVACENVVNVQTIFDGTPTLIKYTIYDTSGTVVFTAFNTSQLIFTLPGTGVFYGIVEASCGGADKNGGDEDEDVFEINNSAPIADFSLASTYTNANGFVQRTITTSDFSQDDGILTYSWKVTEVSSGTFSIFSNTEPTYPIAANKNYEVDLVVTNTKGCMSNRSIMIDSISKCKSNFEWWYEWCETCKVGSQSNVTVNFENKSSFSLYSSQMSYQWDFGDGSTSFTENPQHTYLNVPCPGKDYTVRLTMTLGNPMDPNSYCQSVWDTTVTINNHKVLAEVQSICCDGLVFFHTDAVTGDWDTPGSLGIPKWPSVSKKIHKSLNLVQLGQNYRQYYNNPGTYYIVLSGSGTNYHNRCPVVRVPFTISKVECFNRNRKVTGSDVVDGITVKYKFSVLALPLIHHMKSKIKTVGFKKAAEISTSFTGVINSIDAMGCYCSTFNISDPGGGVLTNKRKAKAKTSTSGKFRIGMDKVTASFYIKTKAGTVRNYILKLGNPPCDHPWFLFY